MTEDDVRRLALALPETTEQPSYGAPGFRVKEKLFARIREEGDVLVVWVGDLGEKEALIASEPKKFFTTPHYDGHPTVLVRFRAVGVKEVRELLTESWRVRAPRRLVERFDAASH
ncbi:MAG TPA: MmcQ/YjbR family DNA-binding protein [Acidimicrobiales bacterium]|nr:MmcQ/YjbR family DNA-binding protein [Acidimicrobiales bacterium]